MRRYGGDAYDARALVDGARTSREISLICGGRGRGRQSRLIEASGRNPKNEVASRIEAQSRRRGSRDTHLDIVVGPLAEQLDVRNLSHGDLLAKTCCASKRGRGRARSAGKTSTAMERRTIPACAGNTDGRRVEENAKQKCSSATRPLARCHHGRQSEAEEAHGEGDRRKGRGGDDKQGGGKAGLADRQGGAAGHAKFKCPSCGQQAPSIKSAEMHWDSKHSKLPFVPDDWSDMHALNGGVTTAGVAVKGSSKEKTNHQLSKTQTGQEKLKQIEAQKAAAKFQ